MKCVKSFGDLRSRSLKEAVRLMRVTLERTASCAFQRRLGADGGDPQENHFAVRNVGPARYGEHLMRGGRCGSTQTVVAKLAWMINVRHDDERTNVAFDLLHFDTQRPLRREPIHLQAQVVLP